MKNELWIKLDTPCESWRGSLNRALAAMAREQGRTVGELAREIIVTTVSLDAVRRERSA